jgi:dTDP-4-amino-4,6-dideoxygalactose transaminase
LRGLNLPSSTTLGKSEVDYIIEAFTKILEDK